MPASVPLRRDFDARHLRKLASRCKDARQSRRLLSLAAVYDGMRRGEAARIGGMDRQTLRDWVHRFNEEGPDGLTNRKGAGRTRYLSDVQMKELGEIVETGPDPAVDGVVRWRRIDLKRVIEARFGVIYSERGISRLLGELGFAHISARPQHPRQDKRIIEAFKKNFADTLQVHIADLPAGTPVEIWFQDEARLGQKNGLTRLWARKGTRPRQPADQRYHNAYLFGAICPAHGKGAALMLPWADAQTMQMHLDEISRHVTRKGPCGCADGSGRMAHHRQTQSPEEPHHHPAAIARSGTEPGGKYLAVLARQLALQPRVRRLQCHRRCWMRSLEQAHRTARNHHINRNAKMGPYRSMLNAAGIILFQYLVDERNERVKLWTGWWPIPAIPRWHRMLQNF